VKASVSISPAMQVAEVVGQYVDFYVNVQDVDNPVGSHIARVSFTLIYDASVLEFCKALQLSFFPPPPASSFQYESVGSLGVLNVNASLTGSQPLLSGNGTLALVSFKVVQKPASSIASMIIFKQASLADSSGGEIPCDTNGAVCFWQSVGPDSPGQGLLVEYTNKGFFMVGETVFLTSQVTYGGYPVRNKVVAFQILDPNGTTITMGVVTTDGNGLATMSFRLPQSSSLGQWTAFSTVELDQVVFWDTVNFQVVVYIPVGGYSFALKVEGRAVFPSAASVALLLISTIAFVVCKPRRLKRP
jgi:hypothetical protein